MSNNWFVVDKEGLKELHSNFPPARMVMELVQNVWDEISRTCTIEIIQQEETTTVVVTDDNPEGFKDIRDAYTLFRSTGKREDPTKRGRFNYGEKIVLSRALNASIVTTSGTIIFDADGRKETSDHRPCGSQISVTFPKWSDDEFTDCVAFLQRIIPPDDCKTTLNSQELKPRTPVFSTECILPTEIVREENGERRLVRTNRKASLRLFKAFAEKPMIYEMGLPICEIEGFHDIDIGQKVPVSQDRTTLSSTYLREIYAELVNILQEDGQIKNLGVNILKVALESDRVSAQTAATVFHQTYGNNAVIQSNDADADQEAARKGVPLVSSRIFGASINSKFREGGVKTALEVYGRKFNPEDKPYTAIDVSNHPKLKQFVDYAHMLARELYQVDDTFTIHVAEINNAGLNFNKKIVVFNKTTIEKATNPVTDLTSLIVHELAHCMGQGHDGVYDLEYERLFNKVVSLALAQPELFAPYRA